MNPEQKKILVNRADELFFPACGHRLTSGRILDALVLTFEESEKPLLEEILALRLCLTEYNKLKLSQNTLHASLTEVEQALRSVTAERDGLREALEIHAAPFDNGCVFHEGQDEWCEWCRRIRVARQALAKLSNETTNRNKFDDSAIPDMPTDSPVAERPVPHNPDNLTPKQVGVADGWRLLDKDEFRKEKEAPRMGTLELWDGRCWFGGRWFGSSKTYHYRTRLSRAELRAARGLTPEPTLTTQEVTPMTPQPGKPVIVDGKIPLNWNEEYKRAAKAREERDTAIMQLATERGRADALMARADAAEARLATAQADSERLTWLDHNRWSIKLDSHQFIRDAIDAARAAKEQS